MLNIIIPVYNEAAYIKRTFDEIKRCVHSPLRIYAVYDDLSDNTLPVIEKCVESKEYPFEIITLKNYYSHGALNAILTGLYHTHSEYKLVMMADLSDNLEAVDEMLLKAKEGYDVICGSRYMKGGSQKGGGKIKSLLARCAGLSLHFFTGIPTHDCTNSFKMYSDKLLQNIRIESIGGFEIGLEIVTKAWLGGYRITEVPSQWHEDAERVSHFHLFKWLPHYLKWYLLCLFKSKKSARK